MQRQCLRHTRRGSLHTPACIALHPALLWAAVTGHGPQLPSITPPPLSLSISCQSQTQKLKPNPQTRAGSSRRSNQQSRRQRLSLQLEVMTKAESLLVMACTTCCWHRRGRAGSVLLADTTQELGRHPAQRPLHQTHTTRRARTARICCPSLSSRAPTPTIALHLPRIHRPTSSTLPSHHALAVVAAQASVD